MNHLVIHMKFCTGIVIKLIQDVNSLRSRQLAACDLGFFSYLNSTEIYILVHPEIYLLFDRRPLLEHIKRYKYTSLCYN